MAKYLITGNAGTGKTSISEALRHKGYAAYDADEGYGYWIHKSTEERCNSRPTENRGDYYWIWDLEKIKQLLNKVDNRAVFFCGLATNQSLIYDIFDKIILLDCGLDIITDRLKNRQNNPFGKRPGDLDWVRATQESLQLQLPKAKVVAVDANQPLTKVVDEILELSK